MLPTKIKSVYTEMLLEKIALDQTASMMYRYDDWDRIIAAHIYDSRVHTFHAKLLRLNCSVCSA